MRNAFLRSLFGATERERAGPSVGADGGPLHPPRGVSYDEYVEHFTLIPEMLVDIEFYLALTVVGLAENLLSLLLLPLKCLVAFSRLERRDVVALVLIAVGMLTYHGLSLYTTQLYAYLYHVVRRTSLIKLVMVFNILDIADRLLSALSQEAIEVLTMCVQDWRKKHPNRHQKDKNPHIFSLWLPVGSAFISLFCVAAHSVTLLLSVVTLNVAVNAEGHLLLALMLSMNFSEVKGVAYKKHNRDSLLQVTAADAVERLKFLLFIFVMLLQHMHERFHVLDVADMLLVLLAEVFVDFTKHLFVAKFNGISLSVYRSYSQLALLDMAAETVLWEVDGIHIHCIDEPLMHVDNVKALLSASAGFFPKYVRRTGFIPVPYAALLLWSLYPFLSLMLVHAPLLFALSLFALVLLKILLSEIVRGIASRFVVRSLIVLKRNKQYEKGGKTAGVLFGVSPLSSATVEPLRCGSDNIDSGGGPVATLQLTSFLCSLLKLEPFDLQAGKVRR